MFIVKNYLICTRYLVIDILIIVESYSIYTCQLIINILIIIEIYSTYSCHIFASLAIISINYLLDLLNLIFLYIFRIKLNLKRISIHECAHKVLRKQL